ncbi:MAG: hypothetical protein AAF436_06445, partial [Myxococcota bacterium]
MGNFRIFVGADGARAPFACLAIQLAALASGCGDPSIATNDGAQDCRVESSFEAIQARIFDGRGCTSAACHGGDDPAGGLDLREGRAVDGLVRVRGESADMDLVFPGDEERSLLYVKLAAKTLGEPLPVGVAGTPMPFGDPDAVVTEEELGALRAWIRAGASATSIAEGTESLLSCREAVDVDPNKIEPLDAPTPDVGVQFYSGGWFLPAESED